jgi:hypothetical protein
MDFPMGPTEEIGFAEGAVIEHRLFSIGDEMTAYPPGTVTDYPPCEPGRSPKWR